MNISGWPILTVIGCIRTRDEPRGIASNAPNTRIGTTGTSVLAMMSPMPGCAGCNSPSSVRAPSGKTMVDFPRAQQADDALERAHVRAFLIDGHDVEPRENRPQHRPVQQRLARQEMDRARVGRQRDDRRVEIALVVHRQQAAARFSQAGSRAR